MYTIHPKKLMIIHILDILKRHTDADHRLSQKDIADILRNEYSMHADRKAVRRNLMNLIDFGYEIEYSETLRMMPNPKTGEPEESSILSDFYLVRDFTDGELRLLIDSLLFSKHIPYSQSKALIGKLEGLSNRYFHARVKHIHTTPDNAPENKQLFLTIEVLDEAISKQKQVSFVYNTYGSDKKLHPRLDSEGKPREYIINPYQMVAANGRYYLICNYDKYDNVANYRLDRITDIRLLGTPVKPMQQVEGLAHGLDLSAHMAEHVYMFSGESIPVTFRMEKHLLNDVMDWFGRGMTFFDEDDTHINARIQVNRMAMRKWALQYALYVKILSPASLAEEVKADLTQALEHYHASE